MNNLFIVSCTKENEKEFYNKTPLGRSIKKINLIDFDSIIDKYILYENTKGLSECYNEFLEFVYSRWIGKEENRYLQDPLYALFVHDDVYLNDMFFMEKLEEGFDTFDILGIAGSSDFSLNRIPVCWHNCLREEWSGGCFHPKEDKSDNMNEIYFTDFGSYNKSVAVIDGVFMAVNLSSLYRKKIFFDKQFTFDFYDLDFCLNCLTNNLKIGISPIILTHMSHGVGIRSERYKLLQDKFIEKWKKEK